MMARCVTTTARDVVPEDHVPYNDIVLGLGTSSRGVSGSAPPDFEQQLQQSNISLLESENYLLQQERDTLKLQLDKYKMERGSSGDGSDPYASSSFRAERHYAISEYDQLKGMCERAMSELKALKMRQGKTVDDAKNNQKEAEYYRAKYKTAKEENQQIQGNFEELQNHLNEVAAEKQQLELELHNAQRVREAEQQQLIELRQLYYENKMHDPDDRIGKLDAAEQEVWRDQYDNLYNQFSKHLKTDHSMALKKAEAYEKENIRLKRIIEDARGEKNLIAEERSGQEQRMQQMENQWEIMLREKNEALEKCSKTQLLLDKTTMELNREVNARWATNEKAVRMQKERNTAVDEHRMVMSERAEVIKEIEKLQDERESAAKQIVEIANEKKTALSELESLRREISSALDDRDKAIKECYDLREKIDVLQKDTLRSGDTELVMADLQAANRLVEKYKEDLQESQREAEISNRRRAFAFQERDKVILEREGIKSLCDSLRGERDKSVAELAEVLRGSDDAKRQLNDVLRECQELRDLLEHRSLRGNPRIPLQYHGHTDSRDSAIDTEFLSEVYSDTFEVDLNLNPDDPGFLFSPVSPDSAYPSPICISHVSRGSPAEGKLQVSDVILRMNNVDLKDRKKAVQLLQTSKGAVHLVVRRRKTSRTMPKFIPCNVRLQSASDLLRNISKGLFVTQVSSTMRDVGLYVGDRITHLDGESVNEQSADDAMRFLENYDAHPVHVKVLRAVCASPSLGGVFGSDGSDGDRTSPQAQRSPDSRHSLPVDVGIQTDLGDLSRNNSTVRQKRTSDVKDKNAWKSLFGESKERVRPRLDGVFPIEVTPHTTVKSVRIPSSGREAKTSLLDRAYDKIFRRGDGHKRSRLINDVLPSEEQTVIEELETVVKHYDSPNGTRSTVIQKVPKMPEKLPSGTWPKYKGSPLDSIENILEITDKRSVRGPNRKSVMSLSANQRNGPSWYCTDIPIDDMDSGGAPNTGTLKSPKTSTPRQTIQPDTYRVSALSPHTPPEQRHHRLSVHPDSVDIDSSSMSSSLDFIVNTNGRGRNNREFYPPPARPLTGSRQMTSPGMMVSLPSPVTYGGPSRAFSPGTSSLYGTIQSRASRLSNANAVHGPTMNTYSSPSEDRAPFLYGDFTHQPPVAHHPPTVDGQRRPISLGVASRTMWNEPTYSQPRSDVPYVATSGPNSVKSSSSRISTSGGGENRSNEVLVDRSAGPPLYDTVRKRPQLGQVRTIVLRRSNDQLGFKFKSHNGGIYISVVKELSLAAKEGMVVGDQLLEVCAINLRSASYEDAKRVILNAGHTLTLQLRYRGPFPSASDSSDLVDGSLPSSTATSTDSLRGPTGTLKGSQRHSVDTMTSDTSSNNSKLRNSIQDARSVRFTKDFTEPLGVNLIGGNVHGIFIHSVTPGSAATGPRPKGLGCGEQILEYNGINMRSMLLETAMRELCKPVQDVSIIVQFNRDLYELACATSGDAMFVKTLWDRDKSQLQDEDLVFQRGDILFVDNTLYNGEMGQWRAWRLDENADKVECGIVPNRYKAEEEVVNLQQSNSDLMESLDPHRRGGGRRSLFKKKKHHTSSRRELASFSSASLGCDTFSAAPEEPLVPTYQRVSKLVYNYMRPVLILGPLSETVVERLLLQHPQKYAKCPVQTHSVGMDEADVIESRQFSGMWELVTAKSIREVAEKDMHCVVDISVSSVERMLHLSISPIVIVIKFRTPSVIREVRDGSFSSSKISHKAAKELFELAGRMETEHGKVITAVIPGGTNLSYMASLVNNAIDAAQTKPEWLVEGSVL
ncbi:Disks large-like protein 5 [Hypsibius exemplaris]|uniref:Disks large-like protein 5 n=1 Tax=Hypsibius exemplaris TaxID=2072580 RepID=A0A1W0WPJ7_HYPEX|nr:Disks large-like protein 5 [Hypsibius exemplaris]